MSDQTDKRITSLTAAAAFAVTALYAISVPVGALSSFPASDASAQRFASFLIEHRGGLIAALVLNGVAYCLLMPVVFVNLRRLLHDRGGHAATVALVAAAVESALIGVALVFGLIAAYTSPAAGPELARTLSQGLGLATSASAWPTVACVLALLVALREAGRLGPVLLAVGVITAVLHAITAVSFARSGALSPSGIALAAPPAFAVWMGCIAGSLLRGVGVRAQLAHDPRARAVS